MSNLLIKVVTNRRLPNITSFAGSDPLATESRFGLLLTHKMTG